jgi:hypothetical protein
LGEYDLKALGKSLFILKHINKINNHLSSHFNLNTSGNNGYFFEQEFFQFQSQYNDDTFMEKLKEIIFTDKCKEDNMDQILLGIINGDIKNISHPHEL